MNIYKSNGVQPFNKEPSWTPTYPYYIIIEKISGVDPNKVGYSRYEFQYIPNFYATDGQLRFLTSGFPHGYIQRYTMNAFATNPSWHWGGSTSNYSTWSSRRFPHWFPHVDHAQGYYMLTNYTHPQEGEVTVNVRSNIPLLNYTGVMISNFNPQYNTWNPIFGLYTYKS